MDIDAFIWRLIEDTGDKKIKWWVAELNEDNIPVSYIANPHELFECRIETNGNFYIVERRFSKNYKYITHLDDELRDSLINSVSYSSKIAFEEFLDEMCDVWFSNEIVGEKFEVSIREIPEPRGRYTGTSPA